MANYTVRKLKLKYPPELNQLAHAAGELYSQTLVSFWRTVRKKNVWLSSYTMERWLISDKLHAHSSDAVTQSFFASLKSWRARRNDPSSKPPRRRRWYYKLIWKSSAIKVKDSKLSLSNGILIYNVAQPINFRLENPIAEARGSRQNDDWLNNHSN